MTRRPIHDVGKRLQKMGDALWPKASPQPELAISRQGRLQMFGYSLWLKMRRSPLIWPIIAFCSLALAVGALGYGAAHSSETSVLVYLVEVSCTSLVVDLLGIVIAVLVIDRLYERRLERQEKQVLVEQMGSHRPDVADEAVRKLRARGWLMNGVLRGAYLRSANLESAHLVAADLEHVDLQEATLSWANLQHANLASANLRRAILERADLRGASLEGADLQGANLWRANLHHARLEGANLEGANLQDVTMPDGRVHE